MEDLNFENRFWLQVLGDHMRFLENGLNHREKEFLQKVQAVKQMLDESLMQARDGQDLDTDILLEQVRIVKELKVDILTQQIDGKVEINVNPTLINHMLNELDRYELILKKGSATFSDLDHHYLWSSDASVHAVALIQGLDGTEKKQMKRLKKISKCFNDLFNKTIEFIGYVQRTGIDNFVAIDKLTDDTVVELKIFMGILATLREEKLKLETLGDLEVLAFDHMLREENYYFMKVTGQQPLYDPTTPRVEH